MQTFKKEERLTSKKLIEKLFNEGKSFKGFPLRVVWLDTELQGNVPASVLISVQAKRFRNAYQRNLLKRRIREANRKNKASFYSMLLNKQKNCVLAILYISAEIASYKEIEQKIIYIFKRLQEEYENTDR